jgi:hypothetical protein
VALAQYLRDIRHMPEQVQDFYPTPSTLSTVMYYTGLDPRTMKKVYVPRDPHEKAMQRALIQYRNPKNYHLVREALEKAERTDLIGFGPECLIRPRRGESAPNPRFRDGGKPAAGRSAGKTGGRNGGKNRSRDERPPKHGGRPAKSAAPGKGRAPAARGGRPAGTGGKTGGRRKP